jgi:hypothetical protein
MSIVQLWLLLRILWASAIQESLPKSATPQGMTSISLCNTTFFFIQANGILG